MIRFLIFLCFLSLLNLSAHESPIDHVEREFRLWVEGGKLHVACRLQYTERATLMRLQPMDADANGQISAAERDAFFAAEANAIATQFQLTLAGQKIPLTPTGSARRDAQSGQTYEFTAPLPPLAPGRHSGNLIDGHSREYPGAFRWREAGGRPNEIRVEPRNPPASTTNREHPPWIELPFEIVVPK